MEKTVDNYFSFVVERKSRDTNAPLRPQLDGTGKVQEFVLWAKQKQIEFNDDQVVHFVSSVAGLLGHPNTDKLIQDGFADARKLIDAIQRPTMFTGETAIQPVVQQGVADFMSAMQADIEGKTSRTDLLVLKASLRPQYLLSVFYFSPLLSAHIEQAIDKIREFGLKGSWKNAEVYAFVLNNSEFRPKFARLVASLIEQTERMRVVSSRRHQLKRQDERVAEALAPFMGMDIDVLITGFSKPPMKVEQM